eukprot:scaffold3103_cov136-Cylindrotheca_fusiformis.AAC.30
MAKLRIWCLWKVGIVVVSAISCFNNKYEESSVGYGTACRFTTNLVKRDFPIIGRLSQMVDAGKHHSINMFGQGQFSFCLSDRTVIHIYCALFAPA